MIFGKHINRYYLKFGPILLLGLVTLAMVDFLQLEIPKLYGAVINGINLSADQLNAAGDYVVSYIVSRFVDGKDWLQKALKK